jgi:hypothetical protein
VVERRSEEQGVEAGSSATQLAVRQLVVPHLGRPHPPLVGSARSAVGSGLRLRRRRGMVVNTMSDSRRFEASQRFAFGLPALRLRS